MSVCKRDGKKSMHSEPILDRSSQQSHSFPHTGAGIHACGLNRHSEHQRTRYLKSTLNTFRSKHTWLSKLFCIATPKKTNKNGPKNDVSFIDSDPTDNISNARVDLQSINTIKCQNNGTGKTSAIKAIKSKRERKSKVLNVLPYPTTLELGPNHHMQFFCEKRKKIKRMTKGKFRRKDEAFSRPAKSGLVSTMPKVRKTKTDIIVRDKADVASCMKKEMAETSLKLDRNRRVVLYGEQIFATRNHVYSTIEIESDLSRDSTPNDSISNKYDTREYTEYEPSDTPTNSSGTDQIQLNRSISCHERLKLDYTTRSYKPCGKVSGAIGYESPDFDADETKERLDFYGLLFFYNYATCTKQLRYESEGNEGTTPKGHVLLAIPRGISNRLFSGFLSRKNYLNPEEEILCVDSKSQIYVCDIGLTSSQCDFIVNVAEYCSSGSYGSYKYAKQTMGCRENDVLAAVCEWPALRACATIKALVRYLESQGGKNNGQWNGCPRRDLVLDDHEPHVVKYDLSRGGHQKLDMHTDNSEWTFLISLSEGDGCDFIGGGTYFESINSTVHLQKGHALLFPGKLRHRGQYITAGKRFLLVGFLVEQYIDVPFLFE